MNLLQELKTNYRYSDYYLPDERYEQYLHRLRTEPLTQELIEYLCMQIDNPKSKRDCELRFIHLQPLFLNPSATNFNLKEYLHKHITKSRRLWLKLFFIRAYAKFATQSDLIPIMHKFEESLRKNHDYQDYEQILSKAGLPYLVNEYGYPCFVQALKTAENEYLKIDPLLRGFFTLDEAGDTVQILTMEQIKERFDQFFKKIDYTSTDNCLKERG